VRRVTVKVESIKHPEIHREIYIKNEMYPFLYEFQ